MNNTIQQKQICNKCAMKRRWKSLQIKHNNRLGLRACTNFNTTNLIPK
ncbi:hypothetical protein HMPREF1991_01940 [Hoylesella loescheii DSM 19665 = JCM 12249 = ATCC 15930]|uniref:Uncharacterized protein n=1 Tax=Hoylesella loescheii DSM 19665 = JCM 12249 = ATCC 15930 TaxID=1122985 RepID=A0A069QGI3_HOYLO|nr:hypothetical protein HMPREF1991_01940 [Hoylesella loescheii DSM 19665 = JCM 12249 = ATCC 15930]